jgi:ATP-dependent Clp protease ATP-binding subunit ClpA
MMFERFTNEARRVLVDAQHHARRLGHNYLGCEHLLLAVATSESDAGSVLRSLGATPQAVEGSAQRRLGTPTGVLDGEALAAIGIDLEKVQQRIEAAFGPNALNRRRRPALQRHGWWRRRHSCHPASPQPLRFTPRAKKSLELSLREALTRGDDHVGIEHLTLALASMKDGIAPRILADLGVPTAQVRAGIIDRYRRAS